MTKFSNTIFGYTTPLLIIFIIIFSLIACKDSSNENAKNIKNQYDEQNLKIIYDYKNKYNADITWMRDLKIISDKKTNFIQLFTIDIEKSILNKSVLIFGDIDDIQSINDTTYKVILATSSFEIEMRSFIEPDIKYNVYCDKSKVDATINTFNMLYKKIPGFNINVAVITEISDYKNFDYRNSENESKKGILLIGDCKEFIVAPQGHGILRKSLINW